MSSQSLLSPFALLDDAQGELASSRLYTGLIRVLECGSAEQWSTTWRAVLHHLQQGEHAVAVLSYETGCSLHALHACENAHQAAPVPSRVLIFAQCEMLTSRQVQQWLDERADPADPAGIADIRASVDERQFCDAIAKVKQYIVAGDTYQVNYTYRLHFSAYGSPINLYRRLRQRQPVPYGALIVLPDGEAILSMSPELFVKHQAGHILARPMKGTAAASGDVAEDQQRAATLAADTKNRAENVMIVDLLRNDLGRIAITGSVKVSALFDVQRYSSVLQMTSTVEAQIQEQLDLPQVLSALYPCGSITGAPKYRTMQIIREIETEARGIYTGAIGWFDPVTQAGRLPDFCLNVPIRTLHLQAPDIAGMRTGSLGVGAGIVYDSEALDEYAECQLKARFLTGLQAEFELFETMYASAEDGSPRYLDRHLRRVFSSANYFGFAYDEEAIRAAIKLQCQTLLAPAAYRLRLSLRADGSYQLQAAELAPLVGTQKVMLAQTTLNSATMLARHKSSVRALYDSAWKHAEQMGAFDQLFFNELGHLTEGGRSSVFVQIDNRWYTPPLSDGILPGVMRSVLLEDASWNAQEKSLTRADLQRAQQIVLCNALRGAFVVELI